MSSTKNIFSLHCWKFFFYQVVDFDYFNGWNWSTEKTFFYHQIQIESRRWKSFLIWSQFFFGFSFFPFSLYNTSSSVDILIQDEWKFMRYFLRFSYQTHLYVHSFCEYVRGKIEEKSFNFVSCLAKQKIFQWFSQWFFTDSLRFLLLRDSSYGCDLDPRVIFQILDFFTFLEDFFFSCAISTWFHESVKFIENLMFCPSDGTTMVFIHHIVVVVINPSIFFSQHWVLLSPALFSSIFFPFSARYMNTSESKKRTDEDTKNLRNFLFWEWKLNLFCYLFSSNVVGCEFNRIYDTRNFITFCTAIFLLSGMWKENFFSSHRKFFT